MNQDEEPRLISVVRDLDSAFREIAWTARQFHPGLPGEYEWNSYWLKRWIEVG